MSGRSQTPRATRSRGVTPLPALSTRQSHAYGASGKAELSQQVTTTQSVFDQAFNSTRKRDSTRVTSQDLVAVPVSSNRGRKGKTAEPVPEEEPPVDEESVAEDEPALQKERVPLINGATAIGRIRRRAADSVLDDVRPATSLQNSALYAPSQRMPPPPPPQQPSLVPEPREHFQLLSVKTFFILWLLLSATILASIASLFGSFLLPLPSSLQQHRRRAAVAVACFMGYTGYEHCTGERELYFTQGDLRARLDENENATLSIRKTVSLQQAAIAELQGFLPYKYQALREINYAAIGNGAMADPHITSPTKKPSEALFYTIFAYLGLWRQYPNPPSTALLPWDEPGQAWCSSPSPDSEAQLGIHFGGAYIYPTAITIEHIPARATLDIAAAPRDFDLWVQVANETEADRINTAIADNIMPFREEGACRGDSPGRQSAWVCLFSGSYDIHKENWAQRFEVLGRDLGVSTGRVALRVRSNWGGDHTCVYRVRIAGEAL